MIALKKLGKEAFIAKIVLHHFWIYEKVKSQIGMGWKDHTIHGPWRIRWWLERIKLHTFERVSPFVFTLKRHKREYRWKLVLWGIKI